MFKSVPPSVFFGTKTTRGQTMSEKERATAYKNSSTTKAHKALEVAPQKINMNERQMRSALKKSSMKASEPTTTMALVPSSYTIQHNLRARKNARSKSPQQSSSKTTTRTRRAQTPSNNKPDSDYVKSPQEKNLVYKKAVVGSTSAKVPALDEYEFQVETPEGTSKKPKRRKPTQKNKIQTLWGLTVRSEPKKKLNPSKKVVILEPENVKPVDKVIQATIVSKDVQPSIKKTPPLQERAGNTLGNNVASGVVGGVLENLKGDNLVTLSEGKKNTDKGTTEGVTKFVKIRNKQTAEEVKENNPHVKKKTLDASTAKVLQTPLKERVLSVYSNCTPAKTRPSSCAMNNSLVESTGLSPPAINNMSVMLSPIRDSENSVFQSNNQSQIGKSIHASTPVQSNVYRNYKISKNANISCDKGVSSSSSQTSLLSTTGLPQSTSLENSCSHEQFQDFDNHSSSNTASDPDNSDGLYNPEILKDFHIGGKPSIPARLLEGRNLTTFTSNPPQLDRFSQWRQGVKQLAPVGSTDGPWRIVPCAKYIYPYEPTLDNCFGFDNGPDAYAIEVYKPKQCVIQKRHYPQLEKSPCPLPKKIPGPQPEESPCPQSVNKPCIQPEKPCLWSQVKPPSLTEGLPRPQIQINTPLREVKIDEMLSSSLSRLRKKKDLNNTFYDSTTSSEDLEPSSSSQLTDDMEDNITRSNQPVLFSDDVEDIDKSPFTQPPRRSYAHLRPLKRLVEEDEEEEEIRPRNKTGYKRRKMVQTTLLNQWAKNLSSHFAEVDDVELITE